ncbi:MAG: OadG family transporter subunit [Ruminococcus sp.]
MFSNIALAAANSASGEKISISEAAATAIFGYAVVFFGLIILMIVLYILAAIFKKRNAAAKAAALKNTAAKSASQADVEEASAPTPAQAKLAPGSAGHVKLYDVPDKEAAMIMAIVADKLQTPLNELRFISIKEVK